MNQDRNGGGFLLVIFAVLLSVALFVLSRGWLAPEERVFTEARPVAVVTATATAPLPLPSTATATSLPAVSVTPTEVPFLPTSTRVPPTATPTVQPSATPTSRPPQTPVQRG